MCYRFSFLSFYLLHEIQFVPYCVVSNSGLVLVKAVLVSLMCVVASLNNSWMYPVWGFKDYCLWIKKRCKVVATLLRAEEMGWYSPEIVKVQILTLLLCLLSKIKCNEMVLWSIWLDPNVKQISEAEIHCLFINVNLLIVRVETCRFYLAVRWSCSN